MDSSTDTSCNDKQTPISDQSIWTEYILYLFADCNAGVDYSI